jgi:HK97 family phage portal protein
VRLFAADVGGFDPGVGRGPFDDFWYGPLPAQTASGVRVNDETAMRVATFYACVIVISQDIAKVPLVMFRRTASGGREKVTDHPIVKLLRKPSRHLNAVEWKEQQQARLLMRGNAYCEIRTDFRGQIIELSPWDPDNVRVEVMPDESLRYHVRDPRLGNERIYLEGEVLHLKGLALKGPVGLSPVDQLKESVGEAVAAQAYGSSFFGNDARPSLVMEHPNHFKDESVRKDWLNAFRRAYGSSNRFSPMMLEYGIKLANLPPINHSELQFIELRKMKNNEICAAFRVPPHKVGILERSTNNNIEHQGIEYVTDCLLSWCKRIEERLADDLLTEAERDEFYFEFLLDALMRGDAKSRFDAYTSAIGSGWITRNEVRRKENLDDLDGLDEPLEPLNMVPAGSQPAAEIPDAAPTDSGAPNDDAQQARARDLELQARRRALNREAKAIGRAWEKAAGGVTAFREAVSTFYAWHAKFVAEALAISIGVAAAYCMRQCEEIEAALASDAVEPMLAGWEEDARALQFAPLPVVADPSRKD